MPIGVRTKSRDERRRRSVFGFAVLSKRTLHRVVDLGDPSQCGQSGEAKPSVESLGALLTVGIAQFERQFVSKDLHSIAERGMGGIRRFVRHIQGRHHRLQRMRDREKS